jgi:3-methyl-2-oxobutanoate hydroxymethyltransferase
VSSALPGSPNEHTPRVAIADLGAKKARGEPIVMVTAFDFVSAQVAERGGVDIILVGDSAAMTVLGYESTRLVTVEEMLVLTRAARRGATTPLLVGDLPFGSYEESDALALATAQRFVEAGCDAVKMEGTGAIVQRATALVRAGIPVMGHVGLTPQQTGGPEGFRVHGRTADAALEIIQGALALERAGCFAIVAEAVPAAVARLLTPRIGVPVIGIGAGVATDGQVLVFHDLVGLYDARIPRFVKRYATLKPEMVDAVGRYAADVRARRFPSSEHEYTIDPAELERLQGMLER